MVCMYCSGVCVCNKLKGLSIFYFRYNFSILRIKYIGMDIVRAGVEYRLHDFKSLDSYQTLRFTEKLPSGLYGSGTTNEEVVGMLIDRMYELQKRSYSVENQCMIILLKNVRVLLKKRLSKKREYVIKESRK